MQQKYTKKKKKVNKPKKIKKKNPSHQGENLITVFQVSTIVEQSIDIKTNPLRKNLT